MIYESCDAHSETTTRAVNIVYLRDGGRLALCSHHTRSHGVALIRRGDTIVPVQPNDAPDSTWITWGPDVPIAELVPREQLLALGPPYRPVMEQP
jgi:hypothetical protein